MGIQAALTNDGNANAYGNSRNTRMTAFTVIQAIQGRGAHIVGTGAILCANVVGTGAIPHGNVGGTGAIPRARVGGRGANGCANVGRTGAN
jgi:hypothetical protein